MCECNVSVDCLCLRNCVNTIVPAAVAPNPKMIDRAHIRDSCLYLLSFILFDESAFCVRARDVQFDMDHYRYEYRLIL